MKTMHMHKYARPIVYQDVDMKTLIGVHHMMSHLRNTADTSQRWCVTVQLRFIHNNSGEKKGEEGHSLWTRRQKVDKDWQQQMKQVLVKSNERLGAKMESRAYKDQLLPMA